MGQDTFRPRGARTRLEVDQEFKGRQDKYLEERPFEGYYVKLRKFPELKINFCVDTIKKLCSNQAADVSELQVSCQNDLVHCENKKDMAGKTTLVDTSVIKGVTNKELGNCEAEKEKEEEHNYDYVDENIIENIRKVFQDATVRNKHAVSEGRRDI